MLRRTIPGWELPFPSMPYPGQYTERTRWLWLVPLAVGFVAVLGWVLAHDPGPGLALSDRGWLTIIAAAAVVLLLALHRNDGWGRLLRAIAEYTVVAILAALLATSGSSRAPATPDAHTQAATCPSVLQTRAWLTCLWHQASKTAKANQQPSTTTTPATDR
jgi:peptidoglycan/LPS O-acetylase OafA/YrhL